MNRYDFDTIIDRTGTGSIKIDAALSRCGRDDLLPMWVADMDFALPQEVLLPIQQRTAHGIFGYTEADAGYYDVLEGWFERRYHWKIDRTWNTVTPGVVYAVSCAVRALTKPGDTVLIQEPVYYPFRKVIESNGRICAAQQLTYLDGRYGIDMDEFAAVIRKEKVKAFILCSPHNPVGRVWTEQELRQMARICLEQGVKVIADEIHCDFIYPGHAFVPYGTLGEEFRDQAVICTSPSKTFNLAGLQVANILIPNKELRGAFRTENSANGYGEGNVLGLTAAQAAYSCGEAWLEELLAYLKENIGVMRSFLEREVPSLRMIEPEGTYLVWVDFSRLTGTEKEMVSLVRDRARLWLDEGSMFGREAALFERFNIACPRAVLMRALKQLKEAVPK